MGRASWSAAGRADLPPRGRSRAAGRSVLVLEEHAVVGEPVHCTGVLGARRLRRVRSAPRDDQHGPALRALPWGGRADGCRRRGRRGRGRRRPRPRSIARWPTGSTRPGPRSGAAHRVQSIAIAPREVTVTAETADGESHTLRARVVHSCLRRAISLQPSARPRHSPRVSADRPDRNAVSRLDAVEIDLGSRDRAARASRGSCRSVAASRAWPASA